MYALLFAMLLSQYTLSFHAQPAAAPDVSAWPAFDDSESQWGFPPVAGPDSFRLFLQQKGVCLDNKEVCHITLRIEYHGDTKQVTPETQIVGRYVLVGPKGRMEGYAYLAHGTSRYFLLGANGSWQELKSGSAEQSEQGRLFSTLYVLHSQALEHGPDH